MNKYLTEVYNSLRFPVEVKRGIIEELECHIYYSCEMDKNSKPETKLGDAKSLAKEINKNKSFSLLDMARLRSTKIMIAVYLLLMLINVDISIFLYDNHVSDYLVHEFVISRTQQIYVFAPAIVLIIAFLVLQWKFRSYVQNVLSILISAGFTYFAYQFINIVLTYFNKNTFPYTMFSEMPKLLYFMLFGVANLIIYEFIRINRNEK